MKNTPNPTLSARLDEAIAQIEYHQRRLDETWVEMGVHTGELRFWQRQVKQLREEMGMEAFEEFIRGMG